MQHSSGLRGYWHIDMGCSILRTSLHMHIIGCYYIYKSLSSWWSKVHSSDSISSTSSCLLSGLSQLQSEPSLRIQRCGLWLFFVVFNVRKFWSGSRYIFLPMHFFHFWWIKIENFHLFKSPYIANLKILGLIPLSQIPNFLGVPARKSQIRKFIWLKSANSKFAQISTKYCTTLSQNSPKYRLFITIFF